MKKQRLQYNNSMFNASMLQESDYTRKEELGSPKILAKNI